MKDQVAAIADRWEPTFLGDVVTLHYGKALAKDKRNPLGSVAVYGANGIKDRADVALAEGPSLIIGRKGSAGEVTRVNGPFWPLDVTYYTSHDESRIDFYFLEYALSTLDLPSLARGVKPGINRNDVYSLPIPLPPLEEQKRIVAVLDQAFAALNRARAYAEASLADLDNLILSASRKTFDALDAEWHPLGSLCEIYQPKTISAKEMSPDGEYVVFGANGKIGRYHAYNHAEPQLLVTCRGATCGQINISDPFSWITGNAMVVRPKGTEITSDFLEHFFRDAVDWDEVITGAAQPQITRQSLSPMLIPISALSEQDAASEKLGALREQVETLRSEYQIKLGELANLRQSLLQEAFSGQLT